MTLGFPTVSCKRFLITRIEVVCLNEFSKRSFPWPSVSTSLRPIPYTHRLRYVPVFHFARKPHTLKSKIWMTCAPTSVDVPRYQKSKKSKFSSSEEGSGCSSDKADHYLGFLDQHLPLCNEEWDMVCIEH